MLRIKEILKEKHITGVELAKRIGKTPQYINGIVNERGSVSIKKLQELADVLGIRVSEMFADFKESDNSIAKCPYCGKKIRIIKADDDTLEMKQE